jgi:hypothetical protein
MFANHKYNARLRANSVRLDEILHLDTMLGADRLPALRRLKDDLPFIVDALANGGMSPLPGLRAAKSVEELEHLLTRLAQLDSLGFLVKASQPVDACNEEASGSRAPTRSGWFHARSYEKVLGRVHAWAEKAREWAEKAREQALAHAVAH